MVERADPHSTRRARDYLVTGDRGLERAWRTDGSSGAVCKR